MSLKLGSLAVPILLVAGIIMYSKGTFCNYKMTAGTPLCNRGGFPRFQTSDPNPHDPTDAEKAILEKHRQLALSRIRDVTDSAARTNAPAGPAQDLFCSRNPKSPKCTGIPAKGTLGPALPSDKARAQAKGIAAGEIDYAGIKAAEQQKDAQICKDNPYLAANSDKCKALKSASVYDETDYFDDGSRFIIA